MQNNLKLNAEIVPVSFSAKSSVDRRPVVLSAAELKLVSGGAPKSFWAPEAETALAPKSFW